jgi:hypothetical protein
VVLDALLVMLRSGDQRQIAAASAIAEDSSLRFVHALDQTPVHPVAVERETGVRDYGYLLDGEIRPLNQLSVVAEVADPNTIVVLSDQPLRAPLLPLDELGTVEDRGSTPLILEKLYRYPIGYSPEQYTDRASPLKPGWGLATGARRDAGVAALAAILPHEWGHILNFRDGNKRYYAWFEANASLVGEETSDALIAVLSELDQYIHTDGLDAQDALTIVSSNPAYSKNWETAMSDIDSQQAIQDYLAAGQPVGITGRDFR